MAIKVPNTRIRDRQLTKPKNFRVYDYQDEWLQQKADAEGHGEKVVEIRKLIDQAISKEAKRKAS